MVEIRNSSVLDLILDHAKKLDQKNDPAVTAERFVVSLLDYLSMPEYAQELSGAKALMEESGRDWTGAKAALMQYIEGSDGSHFEASLYMQRKMYAAKAAAAQKEQELLTPEIILKCILDDPSEGIRKCFSGTSGEAASKPDERKQEKKQTEQSLAEIMKIVRGATELPQKAEKPKEQKEKPSAVNARQQIAELTERVKSVHAELSNIVFGQDNAVSVFTSGYFQAELLTLTDKKRVRPPGDLPFCRTSGRG